MKTALFNLAAAWQFGDSLVPKCSVKDSPDCGWEQLFMLFNNILMFLVYISAFLAGLGICYAGYLYIRYSDNPGKRSEAKQTLWKVVVGFIAVLAAAVLVRTILNFLIDTQANPEFISIISRR